MKLSSKKITIDIINLITFLSSAIIGILIQINYHVGRKSNDSLVLGWDRTFWHDLHVIISILFVIGLAYHIYLNFSSVKFLINSKGKYFNFKYRISRLLTFIMIITGITGIVSYIFYLSGEYHARFMFLEIHDKLGIIITILFIIHFVQHFKWIIKSLRNNLQK